MAMTKEEHARNQRRRARQMLGLVIALLALLGVFSILNTGAQAVTKLMDDTDQKLEFQQRLNGMVMFDPLPFSGGIENCSDVTVREVAVWGTVYSIIDGGGNFDNYQHDAVTEQVMLPAVEVDAYLAKLVGPDFKLNHQSFVMDDMELTFDEVTQCYLIPVTGSMGSYECTVHSLKKKGGYLRVTAGYIPTDNVSDFISSAASAPTKYMDYLFRRANGNWYLVGLEESETKAEAVPTPTPGGITLEEYDEEMLQQAILEGLQGEQIDEPVTGEEGEAQPEPEADSAVEES